MVQKGGDLKGKLNGVSRGWHSCPCGHHTVQSAWGWKARLQFSRGTAGGAGPSAVAGGLAPRGPARDWWGRGGTGQARVGPRPPPPSRAPQVAPGPSVQGLPPAVAGSPSFIPPGPSISCDLS